MLAFYSTVAMLTPAVKIEAHGTSLSHHQHTRNQKRSDDVRREGIATEVA